jgi:CheY-like chemotaxis protein
MIKPRPTKRCAGIGKAAKKASKSPGVQMRHARVFLVEDEGLIRLMLAEMIEELGHQIVAEAGSIESALPLAETAAFDIAILDVNIDGYYIDKVAQTIVRRGLPFIFVTGYAKAGLPPAFIDRPHLQKPCLPEMLRREITSALGPEAAWT